MRLNKALRLVAAAVVMLMLLCLPAQAKTVSPGPDFFYLDSANVLSEQLEGEIYFANKLLNEACGAQIVVVAVDSTGREAIDDYAYDLFNDWGIGDASRDNGFLLLLAIADDDYYYCTGRGLDSTLSRGTLTQYRDKYLEGDFAAKRYENGVKKFFEAVFERVSVTYNADVSIQDALQAYDDYVSQNSGAQDFGGYTGSRRMTANNNSYDQDDGNEKISAGFVVFVLLLIMFIVIMSKGSRARRRSGILPPPPPPPPGLGGIGYRPTRTVYHGSGYRPSAPPRSSGGFFGGFSGSSDHGSSSSSRSSFGGSSRSSFGGGSRSSGFGGGSGGGGRTAGGGGGRGRH